MNERILLEQAVYSQPYDRATIRALADWLHENTPNTFRQSCRVAATIARQRRNELEIINAAPMLHPDCWWASELLELVARHLRVPQFEVHYLEAVPGSRPPQMRPVHLDFAGLPVQANGVFIGARWIVREVEAIQVSARQARRKYRRSTSPRY